jgi:lipopolysaccharide export system protein LptA
MACKFHAAMMSPRLRSFPLARLTGTAACALALLLPLAAAHAEQADRDQPMTIQADQQSTLDLLKQIVVFNGNVVITQGTMAMHADRVEVRQSPEGFRSATAIGHPASFRQKRQGLDETIEGFADRIEYDGQADTVRFIGHAKVHRLRGGAVADEITGDEIAYNNVTEVFRVAGGPSNVSPANPSGRVRAVLTPAPAHPASAPPAQLKPSGGLGEQR